MIQETLLYMFAQLGIEPGDRHLSRQGLSLITYYGIITLRDSKHMQYDYLVQIAWNRANDSDTNQGSVRVMERQRFSSREHILASLTLFREIEVQPIWDTERK